MEPIRARPLWAEIDLEAIEWNYLEACRRAAPRAVIAAVKGDAYGHGCVEVARVLERHGAVLWTGNVPEALAIRAAGIASKIVLFGGPAIEAIPELLAARLTPSVFDLAGARIAAAAGTAAAPSPVYVKIDAGLGRLGIPIADAREAIGAMAGLPGLEIEGVYTHLPFADAAGRDWALEKSKGFAALIEALAGDGIRPPVTQLWGSSGLLAEMPDPCNTVCIGHALYGLTPLSPSLEVDDTFRPAIRSIKARLIHVAHHAAGQDLAIGGQYSVRNAAKTGVVPLGVSDGMRRLVPGTSPYALVRGRRAPIIGTSLEHTVIDLDAIDMPQVGEDVVLLGGADGERVTLGDWSTWLGCSELDVAMGFSGRIQRRFDNPADSVWGALR
jgi:alanine racemase